VGAPLSATSVPTDEPADDTGLAEAAPVTGNPTLSDEQDFDAVSARETIESDAERLARLRAEYQVVDPGALPERASGTGPNIVAFALVHHERGRPARLPPLGLQRRRAVPARLRALRHRRRGAARVPRARRSRGRPDGRRPRWRRLRLLLGPAPVPRRARRLSRVEIVRRPSPNCGPSGGTGALPSLVVLHYTAMASAAAALDRLCDPVAEVSAHYLIGRGGHGLRPRARGVARLARRRRKLGRGRGRQLALDRDRTAERRALSLSRAPDGGARAAAGRGDGRWGIAPEGVIAHSDMAPDRKADPGPRFDWRRLALGGLSVWPEPAARRLRGRMRGPSAIPTWPRICCLQRCGSGSGPGRLGRWTTPTGRSRRDLPRDGRLTGGPGPPNGSARMAGWPRAEGPRKVRTP
jgi:N-acetylmuramoyl-L-alanine amidase